MSLVRLGRTGLIVPRGGLRMTRTVAYLTGYSLGGEATADGASLDHRERMGLPQDAQVVPGAVPVFNPACARPTFKEEQGSEHPHDPLRPDPGCESESSGFRKDCWGSVRSRSISIFPTRS